MGRSESKGQSSSHLEPVERALEFDWKKKGYAAAVVLAVTGVFLYALVTDPRTERDEEPDTPSTSATPSSSATPSIPPTPSISATPSSSATPPTSTGQPTLSIPPWVNGHGPNARRERPPPGHRSPVDISSEFHPHLHLDA